MIIDAHQHVFWHGCDDEGLVADLDANSVDVAWLLSWEIPSGQGNPSEYFALNPMHLRDDGTHAGIPLSDLLLARSRHPRRFVVGYCPDPATATAATLFEAAYRMHQVRICGEWKFRMLIDDPRCLELFRTAGRLRCPVVLHLDVPYLPDGRGGQVYQPHWYGGTIENLERALRACPQTNFVGHAPGFWREISGDAGGAAAPSPSGPVVPGGSLYRMFETYPNLYADLSAGSGRNALQRDPEQAKQFLQCFDDRLLFGRDTYGGDLRAFLESLELPPVVTRKIYSENALRLVPAGP